MKDLRQKELDDLILGVIESAHTDSLSDNPQIAIVGRARKAMLEPALRWLTAEEERGTEFSEVICAFCYLAGGIGAKIAVSCRDSAQPGEKLPNNNKMVEIFSSSLEAEAMGGVIQIHQEKTKLAFS